MGVGVKNCEGSETFPCLPQFYGCGKKQQAPQSDTKDFITPGNVVCMSFTFTLVPLSCMEVTQRWAWDDATYRGFASEVSSSEHRKHSLSKRVVSKLAPPLVPEGDIIFLENKHIYPELWREALSLFQGCFL